MPTKTILIYTYKFKHDDICVHVCVYVCVRAFLCVNTFTWYGSCLQPKIFSISCIFLEKLGKSYVTGNPGSAPSSVCVYVPTC